MLDQFLTDLKAIFPHGRGAEHWLTTANKMLCGYSPQQLIEEDKIGYVHYVLILSLGNTIGQTQIEPSIKYYKWLEHETALQAHRGPPSLMADPHCPLCQGESIRYGESGNATYCICRYREELPAWVLNHQTNTVQK